MATRVVDYSPLLTTPTPQEVAEFRRQSKASGAPWATTQPGTVIAIVIMAVIGSVVLVPVLGGMFAVIADAVQTGSVVAAAVVGFFVVVMLVLGAIIASVAVSGRGRWGTWLKMDRFARANGLVFSPRSAAPNYPGAIFSIGDSRAAVDHFRTADGRFLDFGNYRYTTGSGKNRTTRTWGFLALHLDRRLPHMLLDARANNGIFGGSNLPAYFDKSQILSLEGDFDRYFTLYCPKEYERDALYVFTPDLMALLIDEASPFDVEIVDDWMFVYANRPFPSANPAVYQRLFRIVETVGAKTLTQTDRYHDDRSARPFAANVVAGQGTRLKRSVSVGAIVITVLGVLIWLWSFFGGMISGIVGG